MEVRTYRVVLEGLYGQDTMRAHCLEVDLGAKEK